MKSSLRPCEFPPPQALEDVVSLKFLCFFMHLQPSGNGLLSYLLPKEWRLTATCFAILQANAKGKA